VALIAKSRGEGDVRDFQFWAAQKRLRVGNAYATYVFADGATEVLVKFSADVNRMSANMARKIDQGVATVWLLV